MAASFTALCDWWGHRCDRLGLMCARQESSGAKPPCKEGPPAAPQLAAAEEEGPGQGEGGGGREGLAVIWPSAGPVHSTSATAAVHHQPVEWPVLAPHGSGWPAVPQAQAALPSPCPTHDYTPCLLPAASVRTGPLPPQTKVRQTASRRSQYSSMLLHSLSLPPPLCAALDLIVAVPHHRLLIQGGAGGGATWRAGGGGAGPCL